MALNVTPFVGTDNFNMETFNNMISQINDGVNSEISDILAQLGTKARVQTGSYVGTGTYGASNPCSLTLDFEPNFLLISKMPSSIWIIDVKILTQNFQPHIYWRITANAQGPVSSSYVNAKKNEYTINWYSDSNATIQANLKDDIYNYIAL